MLKGREITILCPFCQKNTDTVSEAYGNDVGPKVKDISLCIECGEWSVFGDDMMLRKPTPLEYHDIGLEPAFKLAREAWVEMEEERKKPKQEPEVSILGEEFEVFEKRARELIGVHGIEMPDSILLSIKFMFCWGAMSVYDNMAPGRNNNDKNKASLRMVKYRNELLAFMQEFKP